MHHTHRRTTAASRQSVSQSVMASCTVHRWPSEYRTLLRATHYVLKLYITKSECRNLRRVFVRNVCARCACGQPTRAITHYKSRAGVADNYFLLGRRRRPSPVCQAVWAACPIKNGKCMIICSSIWKFDVFCSSWDWTLSGDNHVNMHATDRNKWMQDVQPAERKPHMGQ